MKTSERYLEYKTACGIFRMCYSRDRVFRANTLGNFNDIIMPSIFNDFSVLCVGPYEYPDYNIVLKKGDTVFDLGANIGLFSCVAASKGCKVYAFEPAPVVVKRYLPQNAALYDTITIVPKAVGHENKQISFYINDRVEEDFDLCRGSIHRDLEPLYKEITVEQITLDDFVTVNNIQKVDFIKSHIEYAENYMLMGAQNILKTFAPQLSFYSQKALGTSRYVEIEKLIRKANPDYAIRYKWRRMYASVPEGSGHA
jgi:FkbM family methyltransferase